MTAHGPDADDPYRTCGETPAGADEGSARFRILRPYARGNLGEVFVAHDAELHREVALKEIQPARADDPDSRRRFLVEAEVTGGLEHPGIVPVYSLGTHSDGRPYYAMRFIRGRSLLEAIEELHEDIRTGALDEQASSLAFRRLLRSIIVASQAIEYAHSRGVIHRDIKPHNIMIGRHGETIVVDWGLAKAAGMGETDTRMTPAGEARLDISASAVSDLTATGSLIGTPAYMSPEQASGRHDLVSPASDIYSLGATLYHLLAGRAPFRGESVADVLQNVLTGRYAALHAVQPRVSRALEAITSKAMATSPADRYATAAALADDLEFWLADQPFATYRERPIERLFRWLRRHRTWAVAGFTAVAATALISLVAVRIVDKQRRLARQLADDKTTLAESERASRELAINGIYRARAGELAAASRAIRSVRPDLGVLLAVEGIEMTTRQGLPIVPAAEESLREAIMQVGGMPFRPTEPMLALSAAGRWLVCPSQFFDMDAIDPYSSGVAHGVSVVMACSSADESRLALLATDGSVTVIDPNDALRQPLRIPPPEEAVTREGVALQLSPDAGWLLVGSDTACRLHDLRDAARAGTAVVVRGRAASAVFSPDGRQMAIQATEATQATDASQASHPEQGVHGDSVHVWRLDGDGSGALAGPVVLAGDTDHRPLAFSPNSQEILTRDGDEDSRVRRWSVSEPGDGDVIAMVPGETAAIFLAHGDRLVLMERKGELKGWRLFSVRPAGGWVLEHVVEIATPEESFSFACSDTWLVASLTKAEISAWNLAEEAGSDLPDCTLRGHNHQASQLAFSRDGRRLVSLGKASAQKWDFTVPHPQVINQTLAPRPGTLLARPDAPAGGSTGERVMSPDGHWLAIDGEDAIVRVLDLTTNDPMRDPIELIGHGGKVVFHTFSRDSRWLATGAADHTICVWDLSQMPRTNVADRLVAKPAVRFSAEGLDPACLRFGVEPGQLWAAGPTADGGVMVLWEWSPARPDGAIRRARIDGVAVRPRVAFTLSAEALTVMRGDGSVQRHQLRKGVPVGQPEPVAEGAAAIAPATAWTGRGTGPYARSPDGRWRTDVTQDSGVALVMIDDDGREQTIRLPRDPEATFQCAAFSGDSRVLATGSSDGGLQVWDLSAENIARSGIALRGHTKPVQYIEFDRSDHWLVSSSTHSIRLWENDVTKLIALARRATGRTLTADERAQYGIDEAWDARPAAANADRR